MRQLLAHDGHGHADPQHDVVSEGRSDGQAVNEVVQAITKDHHVGHRGHLPVVVVVMAVVTVAIHCLLLVQDENVSSLKNDKRILYACLTHLHLCTYLHKDNYICCYVMCRYIFPRRYTCCYICVHTPMKIITSAVTLVCAHIHMKIIIPVEYVSTYLYTDRPVTCMHIFTDQHT